MIGNATAAETDLPSYRTPRRLRRRITVDDGHDALGPALWTRRNEALFHELALGLRVRGRNTRYAELMVRCNIGCENGRRKFD